MLLLLYYWASMRYISVWCNYYAMCFISHCLFAVSAKLDNLVTLRLKCGILAKNYIHEFMNNKVCKDVKAIMLLP